ncbi:MAG: dihydropteroate synthase [Muribaculaceae bacterium]|nr:dihydropteroate synthase [Muribaculaceae bacterium]
MTKTQRAFINIRGRLMDLSVPKVMGILNVTPDSFYASSRSMVEKEIEEKAERMISEGVDIIDVGGCSTRPGFHLPTVSEEWERVDFACRILRGISSEIPLSIDTFRAEVAERSISKWDVAIINDVSGGADPDMWPMIGRKKVAYVLTHNSNGESYVEQNRECGEEAVVIENIKEERDITATVITELSVKIDKLHQLGVNDVIIDPGFGFSKTIKENFQLLRELNEIVRMNLPVMVGISRKSMIYKTLGGTPEESLAGTVVLDTVALLKGASILRVHDIAEAVSTIKLVETLNRR